jgi:CheY-like chemotaxis protein/Tfp pilus assembly protein PilZ
VRQPVLVVASRPEILLGLAQALLKFGYQIATAHPEGAEIDRAARMQPSLVLLSPPASVEERRRCLALVRDRFSGRAVPVLACVASEAEGEAVRQGLGSCRILAGSPLRLNDLYLELQKMFDMARRRELRITTELVAGHREPGMGREDFFYYDTLTSLSMGGCYIKTDSPHPVGTAIEMVFCPGTASRPLRLRGRVRRHGSGGGADEPAGMGIEFEPLAEDVRAALESYLMSQIGSPGLPAEL